MFGIMSILASSSSSSFFNNASSSSSSSNHVNYDYQYFDFRPVLYITTHMSDAHIWYLDTCWLLAMSHSQLLAHADVMVYVTYTEDDDDDDDMNATLTNTTDDGGAAANTNTDRRNNRRQIIQILRNTFQHQSLTIHLRPNPGYEAGALSAMKDAMSSQWFTGYDWLIRLNPDVILRNETFILNTMLYDVNATGILINCDSQKPLSIIHTDFFALKPSALPHWAFGNVSMDGEGASVEGHFADDIREAILDKGHYRWVPGSEPTWHTCRAGFGRRMEDADVVHHHLGKDLSRPWAKMPKLDHRKECPVPF